MILHLSFPFVTVLFLPAIPLPTYLLTYLLTYYRTLGKLFTHSYASVTKQCGANLVSVGGQ